MHDGPRRGGAALTGRAEGAHGGRSGGHIEVGVLKDDDRVLAPELTLHRRTSGSALGVDHVADLGGSGERDGLHVRVSHQPRPRRRAAALDQVDHAVRHARVPKNLDDKLRAPRGLLRAFEDDGIASDQSGSDFPRRDGDREVPRGDQPDHAQGATTGVRERIGHLRGNGLAAEPTRLASHELDDGRALANLALTLAADLALLTSQDGSNLGSPLLKEARRLGHDAATHRRRDLPPGLEGFVGHSNGAIHIGCSGIFRDAEHVAGIGRIETGDSTVAAAFDPFAADVVQKSFAHDRSETAGAKVCAGAQEVTLSGCEHP